MRGWANLQYRNQANVEPNCLTARGVSRFVVTDLRNARKGMRFLPSEHSSLGSIECMIKDVFINSLVGQANGNVHQISATGFRLKPVLAC